MHWTLVVEDFGKIKRAEINTADFMFFVGENNSGKSYMMELLWGLYDQSDYICNLGSESYDKLIEDFVHNKNFSDHVEITEDFQRNLFKQFNENLQINKESIVRRIFNHDISISHLEMKFVPIKNLKITFNKEQQKALFNNDHDDEYISVKLTTPNHLILDINIGFGIESKKFVFTVALELYLKYMMNHDQFGLDRKTEPIYFPASRTGFLHTYKAIVGNEFTRKFNVNEADEFYHNKRIEGTNLTSPTTSYLEKLTKLTFDKDQQEKYKDEINFLLTGILQGDIKKLESDEFVFTPNDDRETSIPLHVTSSLVAELVPLLLFLKSSYDPKIWMIEEIESHLHPKIQMEVTRFLFRLVNKGKRVWVTTHSDSLFQKVNNLITLSFLKNKQEIMEHLGYDSSDLLEDVSRIKVYQFTSNGGETVVTPLEATEYGFEIPTFNDALEKLMNETYLIQEQVQDD